MKSVYNLLRHAGSLYSLFQWYNLTGVNPFPPLLDAGVSYLSSYVKTIRDIKYVSAIVHKNEAKLGGAGLALLMYIERYKSRKSVADLKLMRNLAEFLIWMQEPSGKFLSKYLYDQNRFDKFESLYYPGEAMLALLRLYQIDPDPRWLAAVINGAEFLIRHPVMEGKVRGHNHWFAIALAELYLIEPREIFYEEFWNIADATLDAIPPRIQAGASSVSMATHGETAVAAELLQQRLGREDRMDYVKPAVDTVLKYCLRFQVQKDDFSDNHTVGGIMENEGKQVIRIDFVQHTLQVISGRLCSDQLANRVDRNVI